MSTESPVSSASVPMWHAPVFMHQGMFSCGFVLILQAFGFIHKAKAAVIFMLWNYGKRCLILNDCKSVLYP